VIVLDTNILLRVVKSTDPQHGTATSAVEHLQSNREMLCIVPQNLYEFWATATRPQAANGLGLPVDVADSLVSGLIASFRLLDDRASLYSEWRSLVMTYQCLGRSSFDARLVAALRSYGLTRLMRFNLDDFARFPGLTLLDPKEVASLSTP
jgi:predicted nucleic acid-binding protein